MYVIGQTVTVQTGPNTFHDGEVIDSAGGYYFVDLFNINTAGWYYVDMVMPQAQTSLDTHGS